MGNSYVAKNQMKNAIYEEVSSSESELPKVSRDEALPILKQVIESGCCVGCGICSAATNGDIPIKLNEFGVYQADVSSIDKVGMGNLEKAAFACPFTNEGPNEDNIRDMFYSDLASDSRIGAYDRLWVGRVSCPNMREKVTSGGIITWLACRLLEMGEVDQIAHVKSADKDDGILFDFAISRTPEQVLEGAKSRYYPVQMGDVIREIETSSCRTLLIALPCFLKGFRSLQLVSPKLKKRVIYTVGLVCGHLKSTGFAESMASQLGILPNELKTVDFRIKNPKSTAEDYGFSAQGASETRFSPTKKLMGSNWGLNFFRYPACDVCDDVFAECADFVVGDAWLPKYSHDGLGHSIILSRSRKLSNMLIKGEEDGQVVLHDATPDELSRSQAGGLRDRRHGLACRLLIKKQRGEWVPEKRVKPNIKGMSKLRIKIYKNRMELGSYSHLAWQKAKINNDFQTYTQTMKEKSIVHQDLYKPMWKRVIITMGGRKINSIFAHLTKIVNKSSE